MAKIDSFQSALRSRPAARRRRQVVALAVCALMLTGLGATTLSVIQRADVLPAEEPAMRQAAVAKSGAATTVTVIGEPGTPAKVPETDVTLTPAPARPGTIQRASKADPLLVQRRHRLAAASPRIEPAAPIAATRPAVARKPQDPPPHDLERSATRTASIEPAGDTAPEREAAASEMATEPVVAELQPEAADPEPQPEAADPVPQPEPKPAAAARQAAAEASRTAPVVDDVNMRAGPSNGANVITVVPSGTKVEVIDCDYWCKVDYSGKRGWIYKSFIRGAS